MHWLLLLSLLGPGGGRDLALGEKGYVVIVHAEHPGQGIPRAELAAVFLGKATRWADRTAIESADQSLRSEVREAFCRGALGLEPRAVLQYWQYQLQRGTGLRPPPVKKNDLEVVEWVGSRRGRIGYVSADTPLDASVKTVEVVEP